MTRTCTVCNHKDIDEINRRLISGDSIVGIARVYAVSEDALWRHKEKHISDLLSKSNDLKAELGNQTLAEIRSLKTRAMEILIQAQEAGDLKTALLGIREARGCLELVFKAEGRIQEQSINVKQQQQQIKFKVSFSDPLPSKFEE
jgi:hypothetical protein